LAKREQRERVSVRGNLDRLDRFLAGVEKPAFRMAQFAVRNPDDAMDIVQDAMMKLVERYGTRPDAEWRALFYRILHSRIADHFRGQSLRRRLVDWLTPEPADEEVQFGPLEQLQQRWTLEALVAGIERLPLRQQQAFLLRTWQEFSVADTARIMGCSEGSVKTHLSRATAALTRAIGQESPQP
jgi:RNA polymerase sigma-70 factor (ECF subfamily)